MSENGSTPASISEPEQDTTVTELDARMDAFSTRLQHLENHFEEQLDAVREQRDRAREDVRELQEEVDRLRSRVDELDARTDMLRVVEEADELSGKQRSLALLQHLRRAAEAKADDGGLEKAGVDKDGAKKALHYPDVDRTTIYSDMNRCERLVGDDDVCWYEDGLLRLNLEAGSLPATVVGQAESSTEVDEC